MPIFGAARPKQPGPEPEPERPAQTDDDDEFSSEQIAALHVRWRNLTDPAEKGGGGFTTDEALVLCGNPRLDWHFAKYLREQGCPFEMIVELTS